jgi:hypothetical protein
MVQGHGNKVYGWGYVDDFHDKITALLSGMDSHVICMKIEIFLHQCLSEQEENCSDIITLVPAW